MSFYAINKFLYADENGQTKVRSTCLTHACVVRRDVVKVQGSLIPVCCLPCVGAPAAAACCVAVRVDGLGRGSNWSHL